VRDEFATCPDCNVALQPHGSRLACDQCHGTLVTEGELVELLCSFDPKHGRTIAWPATERTSGRRCPRCTTMMVGVRMEGVAVERCPAHGVWFDYGELARVLAPDADADAFAADYQLRQAAADRFEYGALGVGLRDIYRAIRDRVNAKKRE
jgi:Zn-finger nucleic acid-binding protein